MRPLLFVFQDWGPLGVLALLFLALTAFFNFYWWYQIAIAIPGFWAPRPLPRASHYHRFAVLIPAHNEEHVIGFLLDALARQDYPKDRYDVYVSCDNCTDRTADIVRSRGGMHALVRTDTRRTGKTWNVRWALDQLPLDEYEAVLFFDADNVPEPDFLARTNDYLVAHPEAEAVQGYSDAKNPDDSWVTRATALGYWYMNRFFQHARMRWKLSAQLTGTGYAIRVSCLKRIGWDLTSVTDDLEFSSRLILAGGRVHWNEWAITYDEKAITYPASAVQRSRWLRGHYWCCWKFGPRALLGFLRSGRLQYLDLVLYLIFPARLFITYAMTFVGTTLFAISLAFAPLVEWSQVATSPWVTWPIIGLAVSALHVLAGPSLRFRGLTFKYLPDLFIYFWFSLTWAPLVIVSAFKAHDQSTWAKTEHTRGLELADVRQSSERKT